MKDDFAGKVVLVTGGSYGIGQAIAERFAASHALVGLTHHPDDAVAAAQVVNKIESTGARLSPSPLTLVPSAQRKS